MAIVSPTTFNRTACTTDRRGEILLGLAESWALPRTACAVVPPRGFPHEGVILAPTNFTSVNYHCEVEVVEEEPEPDPEE